MPPAPVLAFDLGGTRLKVGIVVDGVVYALSVTSTTAQAGRTGLLEQLIRLGDELRAHYPFAAAGVAVRGMVDPVRRVIDDLNPPLTELIGVPLASMLGRALGCPVVVDNDARLYALGELRHGAARGYHNLVCLTLGTGIGTGVAVDGRMLRGVRGVGGILGGHMTICADGPPCSCGNIGCLEALIGSAALVRATHEALAAGRSSTLAPSVQEPRAIFEAAAAGDPLAQELVARFARLLGAGIVTLIHVYDPEIVVLGGGLARAHQQFLPAVQRYVEAHAWTFPRGRVPVVPGTLEDAAALIGVAELACHPDLAQ